MSSARRLPGVAGRPIELYPWRHHCLPRLRHGSARNPLPSGNLPVARLETVAGQPLSAEQMMRRDLTWDAKVPEPNYSDGNANLFRRRGKLILKSVIFRTFSTQRSGTDAASFV